MSDAFLNRMSEEEYNAYHRELFGDEWEDVRFERRPSLFKRLLIRLKQILRIKQGGTN